MKPLKTLSIVELYSRTPLTKKSSAVKSFERCSFKLFSSFTDKDLPAMAECVIFMEIQKGSILGRINEVLEKNNEPFRVKLVVGFCNATPLTRKSDAVKSLNQYLVDLFRLLEHDDVSAMSECIIIMEIHGSCILKEIRKNFIQRNCS